MSNLVANILQPLQFGIIDLVRKISGVAQFGLAIWYLPPPPPVLLLIITMSNLPIFQPLLLFGTRGYIFKVKQITANLTNPCFILATFWTCFFTVHFQVLMMKKLCYKCCNKRFTTGDNGSVQSHDKEESEVNSIITANSGAHTFSYT